MPSNRTEVPIVLTPEQQARAENDGQLMFIQAHFKAARNKLSEVTTELIEGDTKNLPMLGILLSSYNRAQETILSNPNLTWNMFNYGQILARGEVRNLLLIMRKYENDGLPTTALEKAIELRCQAYPHAYISVIKELSDASSGWNQQINLLLNGINRAFCARSISELQTLTPESIQEEVANELHVLLDLLANSPQSKVSADLVLEAMILRGRLYPGAYYSFIRRIDISNLYSFPADQLLFVVNKLMEVSKIHRLEVESLEAAQEIEKFQIQLQFAALRAHIRKGTPEAILNELVNKFIQDPRKELLFKLLVQICEETLPLLNYSLDESTSNTLLGYIKTLLTLFEENNFPSISSDKIESDPTISKLLDYLITEKIKKLKETLYELAFSDTDKTNEIEKLATEEIFPLFAKLISSKNTQYLTVLSDYKEVFACLFHLVNSDNLSSRADELGNLNTSLTILRALRKVALIHIGHPSKKDERVEALLSYDDVVIKRFWQTMCPVYALYADGSTATTWANIEEVLLSKDHSRPVLPRFAFSNLVYVKTAVAAQP